MPLLSFRSLLLSGILLVGAVAQFDETESAKELRGIWFGEEKFPYADGVGRFCSRVSVEKPYLRTYLTSEYTCEINNVDPVNMEIGETWFDNTVPEYNFIEKIDGWECSDTCGDVISDPDEDDPTRFDDDDYKIEAQACGRQLKLEQTQARPWSCDAWQITLLKKKRDYSGSNDYSKDKGKDHSNEGMKKKHNKGTKGPKHRRELKKLSKLNKRRKLKTKKHNKKKHGSKDYYDKKRHDKDDYLVLLTVTYSDQFLTRADLIDSCPEKAVYRIGDIEDLDFAIGSIQLVLQASFEGNDLTNPCNWDCFDDHDGICDHHY